MDRLVFTGQWTAPAAFGQEVTGQAALGHIAPVAEGDCQGVFPDRFPRVLKHVAQGLIIGLAGDDIPIGFNTHVIKRRCTTLHA